MFQVGLNKQHQTTSLEDPKILEDWFGKLLGDQNATNIMSFTVDLGEIALNMINMSQGRSKNH